VPQVHSKVPCHRTLLGTGGQVLRRFVNYEHGHGLFAGFGPVIGKERWCPYRFWAAASSSSLGFLLAASALLLEDAPVAPSFRAIGVWNFRGQSRLQCPLSVPSDVESSLGNSYCGVSLESDASTALCGRHFGGEYRGFSLFVHWSRHMRDVEVNPATSACHHHE